MRDLDKKNFLAKCDKKSNLLAKKNIIAAILVLFLIIGITAIVSVSQDLWRQRLPGGHAGPYYHGDITHGNLSAAPAIPSSYTQHAPYPIAETPYPEAASYEVLRAISPPPADSYSLYAAAPPPSPSPLDSFRASSLPHTHPDSFRGFEFCTNIQGSLYPISFGMPETYTSIGITTFRGNNFRNQASWGTAKVVKERLSIRYQFRVGSMERQTTITCVQAGCIEEDCTQEHQRTVRWTGVGWTGQPAIVRWDWDAQQIMNIYPDMRDKEGLIEVIYGALDGFIYFFELTSGYPTRPRINVGEPVKGSVTVDPRGYPILYVGQGDQMRTSRFGHYIFSLIDGSELFFLNGRDPFSWRLWGAFDGTPLFDTANDRMIIIGENGVVYNIKLNTQFDREAKTISLDPVISRYRHSGSRRLGTENSPAAFSHYIFFADNGGLIQCIDLRTFEPVWLFDAGDDTDASIVLEWEEEYQRLVLYTASSVDLQGPGGSAYLRKLDASNGNLLWEYSIRCHFNPHINGGVLATPVSGKYDISNLIIFWVAHVVGRGGGGSLIALDKQSGEVVWETILPVFGWSSPVAVYTEDGRSFLVVSDSRGNMRLIRGTTGEVLYTIGLGANIEASVAAFGNFLVVGTRGQRIFGIEIS